MSTPNNGINGTLGTGLIGHWGFDGGSLLDESGNGRHFVLSGTVENAPDKDGNPNNSKLYNRTGKLTTEYSGNPQDISVSLWVKVHAGLYNQTCYALTIRGRYYEGYSIAFKKNGVITYSSLMNGESEGVDFPTPVLEDNWHHVVITRTRNSGEARVYVDATLVGYRNIGQISDIKYITNAIEVGGISAYDFFEGSIDEVRIYDRVLDDGNIEKGQPATGEVAELYEMGVNYIAKCETPVATPSGGSYTEVQIVELTCATPDAKIYYTTNGIDPDDNEELYDSPIEITHNTILKVIAYATGYEPSDILTEIYNIEGGNLKMEESQSAGLLALFWKPTGSAVETVLGEVPLDGQEVLSMQEVISFFNTKYAGNHPTEARVTAGASTFTVDLIESPTLRALLSNTTVTSGTKTVIGLNTGKTAITGQLRLHPMYNGSDLTEDIVLLKVAPAIVDERTYATENGRKLIKVVFTVMGVKTALEAPTIGNFDAHINSSVTKVKMVNANDLGISAASAAGNAIDDATNIVNFTVGIGANRAIFFKSLDDFATAGNTSYYEPTADEIKAGSFAPGTVTWKTLTSLTEIPTAATGYYYKAIEIGV